MKGGIKRTAEEHCEAPLRGDVCGRRLNHRGQHISKSGLRKYADDFRAKYAADPGLRERTKARSRERSARRRLSGEVQIYEWEYNLMRKYGLTRENYEALLEEQSGRCGICGEPFAQSPHVDHDHRTGRVRGLLCRRCNRAIGFFDDDPELLERAAAWLG
jgi:hypothetical protein